MPIWLLFSKRTWIGIAAAAGVLLALFLYFQFAGAVGNWWRGDTRQLREAQRVLERIGQVEQEVAAKDQAIADLSRQIQAEHQRFLEAQRQAERHAAEASKWKAQAGQLGNQVARLEAERRAMIAPKNLTEARDELRKLGYPKPPARP